MNEFLLTEVVDGYPIDLSGVRQQSRKEAMRGVFALIEIQHQRLQRVLPIGLLLVALPVLAHHSYAAFDGAHTRTLKGTVKSIEWGNPHVGFHILVKPDGGDKLQEWSIETHSPAILLRYGWTRTSLKYGDHVSVVCNPMIDGSYGCRLHTVTFLDGGRTLETKLSASQKSGPE